MSDRPYIELLIIIGSFNGSIVSNKGFIRQFAPPGTIILDAKWVSAWGGTASSAQFLAQVGIAFASDMLGRRNALWITWVLLTAVSIPDLSFVRADPFFSPSLRNRLLLRLADGSVPNYCRVPESEQCREHSPCLSTSSRQHRFVDCLPKRIPCTSRTYK